MLNRILDELFAISLGALASAIMAWLLINITMEERGYFAYGGEWFVIIGIGVAVYLLIHKNQENEEGDEDERL